MAVLIDFPAPNSDTLLLDVGTWDLTIDSANNIALAKSPIAVAQDVASACRTFLHEVWYDDFAGLPYLESILGERPSIEFMRTKLIEQAMTIPSVASVKCFLTGPDFKNRTVGGQLQITDTEGTVVIAQTSNIFGFGATWFISAVEPA
jgi:hypothetical protein